MENWKDIPGYIGLYQASDCGRIRTCAGKTTSNTRYAKRVWRQRIMKQKYHTTRYGRTDARVSLWKDGKCKTHLVARLVARTWCDGYLPEMTVNHIDGDTTNNHANNLEWLSRADNIRHAFARGLTSIEHSITLRCGDLQCRYRSLAEASRAIGRNAGYISGRMKYNKQITGHDGREYVAILG